eukprot:UN18839
MYSDTPIELRMLGLQSPTRNLSYLKSDSFLQVQQNLLPIT